MKKNNFLSKVYDVATLGISMLSPLLLCTFFSYFIAQIFNLGYWVVIVGIAVGIAALINSYFSWARKNNKKNEKDSDAENAFSNRHI